MSNVGNEVIAHISCPCGHVIDVYQRDLGIFCPECKRFGWGDAGQHTPPEGITWRQGHRKDDE